MQLVPGSRLPAIAVTLAFLSPTVRPACAQDSDEVFATIDLGVSIVYNFNRNVLHEYWDVRPGLELHASTPFYFGTARLGVQLMQHAGRGRGAVSFQAQQVYLGWAVPVLRFRRVQWMAGLQIGAMRIVFDSNADTESEITTGLESRFEVGPFARWSVDLAVRYRRVWTSTRMRQVFFVMGFRRSFGMPGWLRDGLR